MRLKKKADTDKSCLKTDGYSVFNKHICLYIMFSGEGKRFI